MIHISYIFSDEVTKVFWLSEDLITSKILRKLQCQFADSDGRCSKFPSAKYPLKKIKFCIITVELLLFFIFYLVGHSGFLSFDFEIQVVI